MLNEKFKKFIEKKAKKFGIPEEKLVVLYRIYKKYQLIAGSYGDLYALFYISGVVLSPRTIRSILKSIHRQEKKTKKEL